uniref:hypothetical protein n=1 Tax=Bacillus sp. B4EP4a TaxID=2590665 RepID=UPI001C680DC2
LEGFLDATPYWGSVRKMRIYNAKEMSPIKKADFHLKESTFLVILIKLTTSISTIFDSLPLF